MIVRSRQLRSDSTNAERMLWNALRGRRCAGLKFRRQQAVEPYVADFFCVSVQVVIELDGETHAGKEWQDEDRQKYLEAQGLKVLRFTNERLRADPGRVMREIVETCQARVSPMGANPHPADPQGGPADLSQGRGEE